MSPPDQTPPKTTLFCLSCPYEGQAEDAWEYVQTDTETRVRCPNCGTEIAPRSRAASEESRPLPQAVIETYCELTTESSRIWKQFWDRTTAF